MEETIEFYEEKYAQPQAYAYAICLKEDNFPIGYIKVDMEEPHDFGYGHRKEFWHLGIVTEAAKAVIEQVKKMGYHIFQQRMIETTLEVAELCRM